MKTKVYDSPAIEIVEFKSEDIITASAFEATSPKMFGGAEPVDDQNLSIFD